MAAQYAPIQINIFTFPGKGLEEAEAVRDAFIAALKERALDELGPLDVQLVGWRGIEGRDVMVEVRHNGNSSLYELVTPDMASRIVQSHLEEHRPVHRWAVGKDFEAYYEGQTVRVSELLGRIDPLSLEDYQDYDGYKSLLSFYSQGFDSFLQKVVAAGFCEFSRTRSLPCGTAWCTFRAEKQRPSWWSTPRPPFPQPPQICCSWRAAPIRYWKALCWLPRPSRPRPRWSICRPTPRWQWRGCKQPGPG